MNNTFRVILVLLMIVFSKQLNASLRIEVFPDVSVFTAELDTSSNIDESRNRFPEILRDAKLLMSEVVISDFNKDTLEVAFLLSKIFELMMEADQIGEMNLEDKEEFDRFNGTFTNLYMNSLITVQNINAPVMAEKVWTDISEAIEIEMGETKFTVVEDRDGHMPLVRNKQVDQFINYFQTKGKKQFEIWLKRYAKYENLILPILAEHEMPEELMYLAMIESGLNPKAYSKANASGMWQFIYSTGKQYGLERDWYMDERRDPVKATHAACKYLKDLYKKFDNWNLALAAYNAGEGRVLRASKLHQTYDFWQLHSLPRETRNYIPYFLSAAIIAKSPENYGFEVQTAEPFTYEIVNLEKSADIAVLARVAGLKASVLREYNPELRQSATPTIENYPLKLPVGKKGPFLSAWNAIPEDERFAPQFIVHRVRYGESLWTISKKYNISIHDLAAVNKIRNKNRVKVGQKLNVPLKGGQTWGNRDNGGPPGYTKRIYRVRKGDTLGQIAENFNTRASKIRRWNNMKYGSHIIHPGKKLVIWVK
ncbi:MAG: transglycosylase SLT domain-containing protein [Candidatus Neomarinimicrobiota bacterium]